MTAIAAASSPIHSSSTASRHLTLANHKVATRSYELILVVNGRPEKRTLNGLTPHELVKHCNKLLRELGRGGLLAYDMANGNLVFEA